jgi:hypothetical protein
LPDIALGYIPALGRLRGLTFIGLNCQAIKAAPAISYCTSLRLMGFRLRSLFT